MLYANDAYVLSDYIGMAEVIGPFLALCALGFLAAYLLHKRKVKARR